MQSCSPTSLLCCGGSNTSYPSPPLITRSLLTRDCRATDRRLSCLLSAISSANVRNLMLPVCPIFSAINKQITQDQPFFLRVILLIAVKCSQSTNGVVLTMLLRTNWFRFVHCTLTRIYRISNHESIVHVVLRKIMRPPRFLITFQIWSAIIYTHKY